MTGALTVPLSPDAGMRDHSPPILSLARSAISARRARRPVAARSRVPIPGRQSSEATPRNFENLRCLLPLKRLSLDTSTGPEQGILALVSRRHSRVDIRTRARSAEVRHTAGSEAHSEVIDFVSTFIQFFAVIDPIGTLPVFVAITKKHDADSKRRIALTATLAAGAILLFFAAVGQLILDAMGVPLSAFQIAGGLVLFLFALTMIFGESKPEEEVRLAETREDTAIFPLAVPSIAGPGAMLTAVLLTDNARFGLLEQVLTVATMLSVLLLTLAIMLVAGPVQRVIGDSGASIVSRTMGLILASVATASVLSGIKQYFAL